ncbi:putative integral membrane protein YckC [Bacillus mojavensis]|uniref:Integral membrane protein YckC n=1 Tax=Bacillus mojavensis TaxID=72360 RepID=A0ABX6LSS1_BACMO|nr:putative integral membrane protein YckC [Bacillus mojavensis]
MNIYKPAGFWIRLGASLLDYIIVSVPLLLIYYGFNLTLMLLSSFLSNISYALGASARLNLCVMISGAAGIPFYPNEDQSRKYLLPEF